MFKIKTGCWLWVILTALLAACPMDGDLESLRQEAIEKNKLTVSFEANGGTPAPASQRVSKGETVAEPAAMEKDADVFGGWYTGNTFEHKWDFGDGTVTGNMTLYARWIPEGTKFTITFEANGGTPAPAPSEAEVGGLVPKPSAVTKDGYVFGGWFIDDTLTHKWNFATDTVTDNMTLYAMWGYTVTFNSNEGTEIPDQIVREGGSAVRPENPTRAGYSFDNWYTDATFNVTYQFSSPVYYHREIFARWQIAPVTGVSLNATTLHLIVGQNATLTATVLPWEAIQTVTWETSDAEIATVSGGTVTAVTSGTATITVTTVDGGKTAQCTVLVYPADMVQIPAGTFTMGSPVGEPNRQTNETQHSVTLTKDFYMGKYQVTQAQWIAVMGAGEDRTTTERGKGTNYPVYYVSWYDAVVFCNKLSIMEGLTPAYRINGSTNPSDWGTIPTSWNATWNAATIVSGSTGYRLPTEAQWEYACRAGTTTGFNWGTNYINSSQANYDARYVDACNTTAGTYLSRTTTVGNYAPNAWGLYDMHGNVWEWCGDWYNSNYGGVEGAPATDPPGAASGTDRVIRGGSWYDDGRYLRSAYRYFIYPYYRSVSLGCRLVRP